MEKYFLNIYYMKKMELIPSSEMKCPKYGIFINYYWVGELGKVILQARITA